MNSNNSEDNKSSSGTSESERQNFNQKIKSFEYPAMPKRDYNLRREFQNKQKMKISTNLYPIKLLDNYHKFILFSVESSPEIADDNFPLRRQIYFNIEPNLPKCFKKYFWAGKNFFALVNDKEKINEYNNIEINEEINGIKYNILIKKVKEISFSKINDFNGTNQKIKSIIENLFRNIVMKNPNIIKFQDRTIFEIDINNITNINVKSEEKVFKGFITSSQITENGLFMQINNRNKLISGKTALQKINEIRNKYKEKNINEQNEKVNEYFYSHKTVLTSYGSFKTYKIKEVNFERTPENTTISFRENKNEVIRTITIINYYHNQYNINIKDKDQPLLVAEHNNPQRRASDKKNNTQTENDYILYLLPELVYITGSEDDEMENNRKNRGRNIINKTKMDPSKKMAAIDRINDLINSTKHKIIKKKNQTIELKSPKNLIAEWGINIGTNLTFQGRILPQPEIYFKNENKVDPRNGLFRPDKPYYSKKLTIDNIFFVYDKNEKNTDHRNLFNNIMLKFRAKGFEFDRNFHPNKVNGYGLQNTLNWNDIYDSLRKIVLKDKESFGIIFCSKQLEKFYDRLKNYFLHQLKIPTQHVLTNNIKDQKRGNSIQFNLVDQINIKRGGYNYYINFRKEGIIKTGEVFLIIGLDSKTENKKITYSLTSTNNSKLCTFLVQEDTCNDKKYEKNNIIKKLFENAINELIKRSPKSPDYIIIYRQGGNEIYNKRLTLEEINNFTEIVKNFREKKQNDIKYNFRNTKLYYICCNLKSDLKFFETEENKISKAYYNPKSGLIVDDNVTSNNKYEFYLQPQFVNQGTATPCHYQVMYYEKGQNEENDLKIENLEKLSFYLSFYYWTWSGAIRMPSLLKMSSTALSFYKKVLGLDNNYYCFHNPTFI